jgi:multisubunit Na+/H+ antiporter MnhB subunit
VLGLYLRNTLVYDFKLRKNLSAMIACGLPLILYLAGFRSFIAALGFTGTAVGAVEGVIIILIFNKLKTKTPRLFLYFIMAILIFGALTQIFYAL